MDGAAHGEEISRRWGPLLRRFRGMFRLGSVFVSFLEPAWLPVWGCVPHDIALQRERLPAVPVVTGCSCPVSRAEENLTSPGG